MPGLTTGQGVLGHRIVWEGLGQFVSDAAKAKAALAGTKAESAAAGKAAETMGGLWRTALRVAAPVAGAFTIKHALSEAIPDEQAVARLGAMLETGHEGAARIAESMDWTARRTAIADTKLKLMAVSALQMGVAEQDASQVVSDSAQASVVAFEDAESVLRGTTNVLNTYKLAASEASRVQDVLWQGVKRGAGSFAELGEFIGLKGAGAKAMGLGLNELVASIATLGQTGIRGSRALGSLQIILEALIRTTPEAKAEADRLGISWDSSAVAARGFAGWLEHVRGRLDEASRAGNVTAESLVKLGLSGPSIAAFATLLENTTKYRDMMREIADSQGEVGRQFKEIAKTPWFQGQQVQVVKGQLTQALGIGIIKGFAGMDTLGRSADRLAEAIPKFEAAGVAIGTAADRLISWLNANSTEIEWGLGGLAALWGGKKLWGAGKWALGTALPWVTGTAAPAIGSAASTAAGFVGYSELAQALGPIAAMAGVTLYSRELGGRASEQMSNEAWVDLAYQRGVMTPEEMFLGQSIPRVQELVEDSFSTFGTDLGRGLGARIAAIEAETAGSFLSEVKAKLYEIMTSRTGDRRSTDEEVLPIGLEVAIKHEFSDGSKEDHEHRASASLSGHGNADINMAYRFMVVRSGRGVNEVRPMPQNVVLGHIRPSVKR